MVRRDVWSYGNLGRRGRERLNFEESGSRRHRLGAGHMVKQDVVAGDGPGRTPSLRREWSRAFGIMLVLLVTACVATLVGVLVKEFGGAAHEVDSGSTIVASLRGSLVDHEGTAHQLLSGSPVDRRPSSASSSRFPKLSRMRSARCRPATTPRGAQPGGSILAGGADQGRPVGRPGECVARPSRRIQAELSANSDQAGQSWTVSRALPSERCATGWPRRWPGAAAGGRPCRTVGRGLAVTAYFAGGWPGTWCTDRQHAAERLEDAGGDFDRRIEVGRHDELGELAEAFNGMARPCAAARWPSSVGPATTRSPDSRIAPP